MTEPTIAQVRALGGYALGAEILTDDEVQMYLVLAGNARVAAADALQAVAASTVLISKVLRTQDLQTDGAKEAQTLLALADRLRAQGRAELDAANDDGFGFVIVPGSPRTQWGPELTERTGREVWGL